MFNSNWLVWITIFSGAPKLRSHSVDHPRANLDDQNLACLINIISKFHEPPLYNNFTR